MSQTLENAMNIPTLGEWLAEDLPHVVTLTEDDDEAVKISMASYREHLAGMHEARRALHELGLTRPQLDQLATMILKEEP